MSTVQPYPPGTRWRYRNKDSGYEFTEELVLYPEPNGATLTDDFVPEQIPAHDLWTMWVEEYADYYHERWPHLYRPGEVQILWSVTTPEFLRVFEAAPYTVDSRTAPGETHADWAGEDFLTHFTAPVHAVTGGPVNWARLPVVDRGWRPGRGDKAGFVQEATGWKPAPLQPTMDVRQLGRAAGLYVPPERPRDPAVAEQTAEEYRQTRDLFNS
ncbi:MAG TPA: hypothetical protein VFY14_07340 [Streptomyces sp.]|nr:hypothetical protein [Streptomyces sp.]